MKKIVSIVLVVVMIFAMSASAFAAPMRMPVGTISLNFSGTTANCYAMVREAGKSISAALCLYDGGTCIASWYAAGTSVVTVSGSCEVESGKTYTLKVSGVCDGQIYIGSSQTGTCP